ncbi:DUF2268 domain-containing putative Zn-dependent protease [Alicyclobacillus shizuokensis]|uniref:DUF2268 domain-containing putative Zn-dependent protease n=1 Tax=Alicyclobacillus shizuokensis TaxID=392014 RepID=UPI0008348ADD|nr:DUF2268 domain-containing putative Zn-dependent protease [Alicyclobacillus shizuokensis]
MYVIVGLDCTNIYATDFEGCPVTVLCLEATNGDFKEIELLLAHEVHHWKRQSSLPQNIFDSGVHERCVTEGLAIRFSEEVQPGRPVNEYCFVPYHTVSWVQSHMDEISTWIQTIDPGDNDAMSALFSRHPEKIPMSGMPPRTGYVYGYLLVTAFQNHVGKDAAELADADCEFVLGRVRR